MDLLHARFRTVAGSVQRFGDIRMPILFSGGAYEIEAVAADHFTLVCRVFRKACLGAGHWIVRE